MTAERDGQLRRLDQRHFWHPFTPMGHWCSEDCRPLILDRGEGCYLFDREGNRYLDGNSSIWTNIHGHQHPRINQALREQLDRVAHVSALGTSNEPAILLAARLAGLFPAGELSRVFFSDDGSTAVECACKMVLQFWQLRKNPQRSKFVVFDGAYHGDTCGAASLGGIAAFHERFRRWGFEVERAGGMDGLTKVRAGEVAGVIIEPLIQGAAGMRLWPQGMLRELRAWCREQGPLLILDEVMTGFGRTGAMFACQREGVIPDLMALAKGLTGGYLPLAATLVTEEVFSAFRGDPVEETTFFYGHSYCANPLGCAAALASLDIFEEERVLEHLGAKVQDLEERLRAWKGRCPWVHEVRQCGLIAGVELRRPDGSAFSPGERVGARVTEAARRHGLLTRPIRDVLVLMPPLCVRESQLGEAVDALSRATEEVCSGQE